MALWLAVYYIAVILLMDALTPKPEIEDAKPAGDGDFSVPTAQEGRKWQLLWGTVRVAGPNIIWWGDKEQVPVTVEVPTGLFSSEDQITSFKYRVGMQHGLCRGGSYPVDELRRVWLGDDVVYDGGGADPVVADGGTFTIDDPELFGGDKLGNGGFEGTFEFFAGSLSQAASSYLAAFQTESGQQITYNGRCFVAPSAENVYIGNSSTIQPMRFELRRTPNPLSLTSAVVNVLDANPMNVLYELMTDPELPLKIDPALIDVANFAAVGEIMITEGNGFSMLLDRGEQAFDLKSRLEDQMDGVLHFDEIAGLWRFTLARADYDIDTIPVLDDTNVLEFVDFTRGSWEETTNEVRCGFVDRDDEYKDTFSPPAQDGANIRIQDGRRISVTVTLSGVKDRTLAGNIAWRKLRSLAQPLGRGSCICDRSVYDTNPGDVRALTDPDLGFVKLPVRITKVNRGDFGNGRITLEYVQDVFFNAAASGGVQATLWVPPVDTLAAYATADQKAFEAPRALVARDPLTIDPSANKIYASARKTGPEVRFKMFNRTNPSTPSFAGSAIEFGTVYGFALIGELEFALGVGSAYPFNNLSVVATPDSGSDILAAFPTGLTVSHIGSQLSTLLMIDDEFFLVTGGVTVPANVDMDGVYRGVLDSAQEDHASGAKVFLLFAGSGISNAALPDSDHVEIRLAPSSSSDDLAPLDVSVNEIIFQMNNRTRRPYPPSELSLNAVRFPSTTSLEGTGAGEAIGIGLAYLRRDYRATDEIAQLGVDAAVLFADFPANNTTTHEVEVVDDPDGSPATLDTQDLGSGTSGTVRRLDILKATDGALPTRMQFALRAKHDFEDLTGLLSHHDLVFDFDVTSALTGNFEFTALDNADVSAVYTSTVTGQYDFTLSSLFTAGDVEYRIDGGTWTQLIAAGGTTGNIPTVTSGETIEVRHLSSDGTTEKLLTMAAAGAGQDAFAVMFT